MLKPYQELDQQIRLMSKSEGDYQHLRSLVTRYFEGVFVNDIMPDQLKDILHRWEQEQIEGDG